MTKATFQFISAALQAGVAIGISVTCLLAIANLLFGCKPAPNPVVANFKDRSQEIANVAFEAGAKLGYACAMANGSKADLEIIINAQHSNRVDIVDDWFEKRKAP